MISSRSGKDPVVPTSTHLPASAGSPSTPHSLPLSLRLLQHPVRHLRGIFRLARRRRTFAFALLAGSASTAGAVAATATIATVHHMHAAPVVPLAAPKPLAPSPQVFAKTAPKPKHHLLAEAMHLNPLRGLASWYGSVLHGHKTASGETFQEAELTAAHRTLPFGTLVRVTDLRSLRSVVVRINDRGVLAPGRVIDLSSAAAEELGILRTGVANVKLEILERPAQS